jgi:hypothetical protein
MEEWQGKSEYENLAKIRFPLGSFSICDGGELHCPFWLGSKYCFFAARVSGVSCVSSHGFLFLRSKHAKVHLQIGEAN